ncbi:13481_t:CDS:2 [Gigaspora margarita]|uniref:13481_t:CDS:1 n=1 Tax=Gigaspora margarita TaxID=4874 RepID=A0ABN7VMK8_GIGMA|nr:13481_t:CDS:2 [Gigaspora margarita]
MSYLKPEIPKVKCDCGNVLRQKISKTEKNPNRPYYRCENCEYFEWEDENVELNRVLRDPKSLIPTSREIPILITTNQRLPPISTNRYFRNTDDDFQESRAPPIPSLITSQKAPPIPSLITSQKAPATPSLTTSQRAPQNPVNEHFSTNFSGIISSSGNNVFLTVQTPVNNNFNKQEQIIKAKMKEASFLRGQMEKFKKDNELLKKEKNELLEKIESLEKDNVELLEKEKIELLGKIKSLEKENVELKKKEKVGLKNKGKAVDTQQRLNNNELDSKISDLNIKIADLNGKNEQLIQINENLTSKLVSETSRLNQIIGSLQKEISHLEGQLKTNSSHIGTGSNDEYRKIQTLEQENLELKSGAQLEQLSALVDKYRKFNSKLDNDNQALIEENQQLKKENNNLNSILKGNNRTVYY